MDAEERYRCGDCGELHEEPDQAEECCRPEVQDVWICGKCEKTFDVSYTKNDNKAQEAAANACCCDEEGNEIITLADLEEAGQMRMLP
jgi:hypothetical protein